MRVIVKRCELHCIFSDNRHFFDLTLSQKDANYEKMSMVSRGLIWSYVSIDKLQSSPIIEGGPKVSLHTLGLIPTSCFILEGCCFADGILYLLVLGFRRQNLKIRISYTTPIQY